MDITKSRKKYILGLIVLALVIVIWVSSSNLMQYIFINSKYDKPFFLTYFNTSLFSLYLFGFIMPKWRTSNSRKYATLKEDNEEVVPVDATLVTPETVTLERLTIKEVIKLSAMFCPLWFGANYLFNASLSLTSVSSNTILSTTSGLFTLILSVIFQIDKFTWPKLLAVFLSFGGVTMVSLADRDGGGTETFLGDTLALISAVFYACYTTLLKKKIESEERLYMPMFFGFLGAINGLFLFPVLLILNFTNLETLEMPSDKVLLYLFINGMIGTFVSDYLWLLSVLLTSPLIATLGLSLTNVLAMIVDAVFRGKRFSVVYVLGACGIMCGFLLVNADQHFDITKTVKERLSKWRKRETVQ